MISTGIILDDNRLRKEVEIFGNMGEVFFDVETLPSAPGQDDRGVPSKNQVTWMGMATHGRVIKIPMGHPIGNEIIGEALDPRADVNGKIRNFRVPVFSKPPEQIPRDVVFEILNPLFADKDIIKSAHGAPFDGAAVAKYRRDETGRPQVPNGILACTIEMLHLLDENRRRYGLKYTTKADYGFTYDDAAVGKQVEIHRMNVVAQYLHYDLVYGWSEYLKHKPRIIAAGLEELWRMEAALTTVLADMRCRGVRMDTDRLEQLRAELSVLVAERERKFYAAAGKKVNLNSPMQMQALLYKPKSQGGAGITGWKLTDGGRKRVDAGETPDHSFWSTDDESLDSSRGNPIVDALMEYRETNKVYGTYVIGYLGDPDAPKSKPKPNRVFEGKVYPDFYQYGAATGRFSCLSGDTEIVTNRGAFRLDEYIPAVGDLVPTHEGRWMPVLRKIYKGRDKMFLVTLENGSQIKSTMEHRFFTPDGWRYLSDIEAGSTVHTYVGFNQLHDEPGEHPGSSSSLCGQPKEAFYSRGGGVVGHYGAQYLRDPSGEPLSGEVSLGEGTEVLTLEDGREEPDERKEWFPAPRVPGRNPSQGRIPATQGERALRASAPSRHGAGTRNEETSVSYGRSSHRQGQGEQLTGQSSAGNEVWSREAARGESRVVEIVPLGTMGVWDIEVEGDHSYAAHGFLNHNCRDPNLQNVPSPATELGKMVRDMFIPDSGYGMIVSDYGQIELVLLAHFIGHGAMWDGFLNGIDPHTLTAAMALDLDPRALQELVNAEDKDAKKKRQLYGKSINFATVYGAGIKKLASMMGCSYDQAKKFKATYDRNTPEIGEFRAQVLREARRHSMRKTGMPPHTTTIMGRVRRVPGLMSADDGLRMYSERQAFNSKIQGSSADLTKLAMVRYHETREPDWDLLLTVHDELVIQAPLDKIDSAKACLIEAMTGPGIQKYVNLPLKVDVHVVDRWSHAK